MTIDVKRQGDPEPPLSKSAEEALQHLVEVERLISSISANLMNSSPGEMDAGIDSALEQLGRFNGVDRAYVFRFTDPDHVDNTHEWCAEGISPEIDNLQHLSVEVFPWWARKIRNLENIVYDRITDLPDDAATERALLEAQAIRSFAAVPMVSDHVAIGFLGLDSVVRERHWTEETVVLLRIIGEIFANAIRKREIVDAMRESEERYRKLVELSPDLVGIHINGAIVFINRSGAKMLGYSEPADLYGKSIYDVIHPDDRDLVRERVREARARGVETPRIEQRFKFADGTSLMLEAAAVPFKYLDQDAVLVVARNTTERASAERELKRAVSLLQSTLESTADGILVIDQAGKIVSYNRRFTQMWRIPGEIVASQDDDRAIGFVLDQLVSPDQFVKKVRDLYANPEAESFDVLDFKDGRVFERYSVPQRLEGAPVGRVWSFRDVSTSRMADLALRTSEERYRLLFERNLAGVYRNTLDGKILDCNDACARIFGYSSREEVLAHESTEFYFDPADRVEYMRRLREEGSLTNVEVYLRRRDGSSVWVLENATLLDGDPPIAEGTLIDISARKQMEERLKESEERYRLMAENSTDMISRHTVDGIYLYASPASRILLGFEPSDLVGHAAFEFLHPDDVSEFRNEQIKLTQGRVATTVSYRIRQKNGEYVWFETTSRALRNIETGEVQEIIAVSRDVTERKLVEEHIEHQAFHDALTGLPNRVLFRDRLTMALAHARRLGRHVAVMFLDLDQFKFVNDTLGHSAGDQLLREVGVRLNASLREEDTVARMGGDEFTILLPEIADESVAPAIAEKLLETVAELVVLEGHDFYITTSIGIALFPADGDDAETLLKNADAAMYRAKESGRNNVQLCSRASNLKAIERLTVEKQIRGAIERDEFVVHYQPQIDLASGSIVGVEALVRWQDPERGLVYPGEFIGVAEEARLIYAIGDFVLRQACNDVRRWCEEGLGQLRLAVNLSARQFQQREFVRGVEKIVHETKFDSKFLEFEITESIAMQNTDWTLSILHSLRKLGVRIAMDDFGTGQSSLNYIKRFPIDCVKIDQSFVHDITTDVADAAIVSAIITMARGLNLRVIAEGVETEEQLQFLRDERCQEMQGFLFSRPISAAEMSKLLMKN